MQGSPHDIYFSLNKIFSKTTNSAAASIEEHGGSESLLVASLTNLVLY